MTLRFLIIIGLVVIVVKSQKEQTKRQNVNDDGLSRNQLSEMNGSPAGGIQPYQFPDGMNNNPRGDNMNFAPGIPGRFGTFPMSGGLFSGLSPDNSPSGQFNQVGMGFPGMNQNMPMLNNNGMQIGIGRNGQARFPGFQSLNLPGGRQGDPNSFSTQPQQRYPIGLPGGPFNFDSPDFSSSFDQMVPSFGQDNPRFAQGGPMFNQGNPNVRQDNPNFVPRNFNFGSQGPNIGQGRAGLGQNPFGSFGGPDRFQSHFNGLGSQESFNRNTPPMDISNSDFMGGGMRQFSLENPDNEGNTNPYIPGFGFVHGNGIRPTNQNSGNDNSVGKNQFSCFNKVGMYGDPDLACSGYYMCQKDGRRDTSTCPPTTKFNNKLQVCDYASNIDSECNPIFKTEMDQFGQSKGSNQFNNFNNQFGQKGLNQYSNINNQNGQSRGYHNNNNNNNQIQQTDLESQSDYYEQ